MRPRIHAAATWKMQNRAIAVLAALGSAIAAASAAAAADPPRSVMIVVDGSGSMWGRLGGARLSKLQAARDALRRVLPGLPPDVATGLASFGHRRKGDCSDAEVIADPAPGDPVRHMGPIDRLNPTGKGPLVLALREAANEFAKGQGGAIVLLHDGADNCQQDACAAASEIAKEKPGLAIHTIGITLEEEDARQTACIAATTGGRAFDARNADELHAALAEALALATRGGPPPAAADAGNPPQATAETAPAVPAVAGLDATASLSSTGAAVTLPVRWRVLPASGGETPLLESAAARLTQPLDPGRYRVEAELGLAKGQAEIEVADKAAVVRIVLEAGVISPVARATRDGGILAHASYSIRPAKAAKDGDKATPGVLWMGRGGSDIVLPAGGYVVRAESGFAAAEQALTLAPGDRKSTDLVLGSGTLALAATLDEGSPPLADVMFIVEKDAPEAPTGRSEVARSAAATPSFTLPAGTYYVAARAGGTEARQQIAVGPGETVERTIPLGLTRLSLAAHLDNAPAGARPPILIRIVRTADSKGEAARSAAPESNFLLPPGRYEVVVRAGLQNARVSRVVDLQKKSPSVLTIPIEAGYVTLKAGNGAPFSIDQVWEVRDDKGHIVWQTTEQDARLTLAPGRYKGRIEWRGRRIERDFEVRSGEAKTVTFTAD